MASRILLALLFCTPLLAQGQAALALVDGHPLVRATLRSGTARLEAHLLLDLSLPAALVLHPDAASGLGAGSVELVSGGLRLAGLPVETLADPWLAEMTTRHARELQEIPIAGMLGLAALAPHTVVLDGPAAQLWLLPAAGDVRPNEGGGRVVVDLRGSTVQVPVELEDGGVRPFGLDTRHPYSRADPRLLDALGHPDGRLARARIGDLDLAAMTPFRPAAVPLGRSGMLGARVLRQMVLTLQPEQGWLSLERRGPLPFPADEAAYYAIRGGAPRADDLAAFLRAWPDSRHLLEAARELLALSLSPGEGPDRERIRAAVDAAVRGATEGQRGQELLRSLAALPAGDDWLALRQEIATAALPLARADRDSETLFRVQLQLGKVARQRGDLREARRHLLSAVFSRPTDGAANLALGGVYEDLEQWERARSRYFLAMLARGSRTEAWPALQRVHERIGGDLLAVLDELADGRVPALHPLPRDAEGDASGRGLLVEIFTGAHSHAAVAADLAFDALGALYEPDQVVLLRWHLPLPAPEPLVNDAALDRAGRLQVVGPPLVRFGGTASLRDGGAPRDAEALLRRYRALVDTARAGAPATGGIRAEAWWDGQDVHLQATGSGDGLRLHAYLVERTLVFPGQNDLLFHHHVARASLTPAGGVPTGSPFTTSLGLSELAGALAATFDKLIEQREFAVRPPIPSPDHLGVILFLEDPISGAIPHALSIPVSPKRP